MCVYEKGKGMMTSIKKKKRHFYGCRKSNIVTLILNSILTVDLVVISLVVLSAFLLSLQMVLWDMGLL